MFGSQHMISLISTAADRREARAFLRRQGLDFEDGCDDLAGSYDGGELLAVGARAGNILKMIAVAPSNQGGPVLGEIVTTLVERGFAAGFDSLFVFTKPEHTVTFESLNFSLLASQERAALLEYGGGLERWLTTHRRLRAPGRNGCVVANCNPFTLGHRHLIETAARQVDNLYLFVVREDRSVFPFDRRYRLVSEGVRDLPNVLLLDTSHYAVSAATFPAYFLKRDDPVARIQMELDATLFASRIAPYFGIAARFVGSEPHCALTRGYNAALKRILPVHGVGVVEIERKEASGAAISASRVRQMLADDDLAALETMVPAATASFLRTAEGVAIREQLRHLTKATA